MMRFDISYQTRFTYEHDVVESHNELRAAPTTDRRQQVVHYDVRSLPSSRVFSWTDYWGTRVDSFGVRAAHRQLVVIADATVETHAPEVLAVSPRFADLVPAFLDEHREYLERSAHVDWSGAFADEVDERRRAEDDDVVGFVLALHRMVGTNLAYVPGATYVGVPVDEVWARREGVCQDFAHLLVAACRAGGVPARYVSGYLFTSDDATGEDVEPMDGEDGARAIVQTHAWVEVAIPGYGWWGLDPTNRQQVGERHVKIGHGRDYDDVAPLRGVYGGNATHTLDVTVDMRRASAVEAQVQQQQQQ